MLFLYFALSLVGVALALWLVNTRIPMTESIKRIVNVVLALILVGMCLWVINTYVPMAGVIKAILNMVVVVATCVLVLQALGLWGDVVGLWNRAKRRLAAKPEAHNDPQAGTPVGPAPRS